jgi:hypothetical protein
VKEGDLGTQEILKLPTLNTSQTVKLREQSTWVAQGSHCAGNEKKSRVGNPKRINK